MSPTYFGFLAFLIGMSIVAWQWYGSEKKYNTFLETKIRERTREEIEKKSAKQIEIEEALDDLGNQTTYSKLMATSKMISLISVVVGGITGIYPIILIGLLAGWKYPDFYISQKKQEKLSLLQDQLPDALGQLLAMIQAGQTQVQGFRHIGEEMDYPIGNEFRRLYRDISTGASFDSALESFYKRVPLRDIRLFNIGASISQTASPQVTINTLQNIIETIRKRSSQKKSTKSTVMQGKLTAGVLAGMPVLMFFFLLIFMPDFIMPFIESSTGKIGIFLAVCLDSAGYFWARHLTSESRLVDY